MSSPPSAPGWLSELQALLLDTDGLHGFLRELAQLVVRALPEGSSCGVTVRVGSRPATLAASDGLAQRVDKLQYDLGEGPCLDTLSGGERNYVVDTATETRWERFCRRAQIEGVRSVLSLPLPVPGGPVGGFNLYSTRPDGFAADTWSQLEVFAGNAAGALAVSFRMSEQVRLSEDLRHALTSRAVIDRAVGIVMAQQRCDADTAFDILRRGSQNRNIKLRDLAAEIVTEVGGRHPQTGRFEAGGS
jgi:ANTAR domain/GAF domain